MNHDLIRLLSKATLKNGCWEYTGARVSKGYGRFSIQRKHVYAHRAAYLLMKGQIPEGLLVLHSCDNPSCFNPDHLRVGTQKENLDEMRFKGRAPFAERSNMCKRGHALSGWNLITRDNGTRKCRECVNIRQRVGWKRGE